MFRIGIIGAGTRAAWIAACARAQEPDVSLAIADPNPELARHRLTAARVDHEGAKFFPSADALLAHADALDGVIIGTRCDLHAPMALKVAPTGLPLFLEKPA